MLTIVTNTNQTVLDLALQLYGNADAVGELLALNSFADNYSPFDSAQGAGFNVAMPIGAGVTVSYDETSSLMNKRVLQELEQAGVDNIASYAPVFGRLHQSVQKFVGAFGNYFSFDETMAIDRIVRDLFGEKNIDYNTNNDPFSSIHKAFYPIAGGNSSSIQYEVFMSGSAFNVGYLTSVSSLGVVVNNHGIHELIDFTGFSGNNFCAGAFIGHDHYTIVGNGTNTKFYKNKVLLNTIAANSNAQTATANCASYYVTSNMLYKAVYLFDFNGTPFVNTMDDFLRAFQTSLNRL